jgi:DNA primase small subunit
MASSQDYWRHGFPAGQVSRLLQAAGPLANTEIAVEGANYYRRYQPADQLAILAATQGLETLHVGSTWTKAPSKAFTSEVSRLDASKPDRRPLVFDLDLQDYPFDVVKEDLAGNDAIFPCVLMGAKILKHILTDAFGFERFLTFYSGRRGLHVYILDERALALTDEGRGAITSFVSLTCARNSKRLNGAAFNHPNFDCLYEDLVLALFVNVGLRFRRDGGLGLLETDVDVAAFLSILEINCLDEIEAELLGRAPEARWTHLVARIEKLAANPKRYWVSAKLQEAVLSFTWPRPDVAVSAHLNHLLKIPFAAHASTGRIAVPIIDPTKFRPADVPTIHNWDGVNALADQMCRILDSYAKEPTPPPPSPVPRSEPEPFEMDDIEDLCPPPPPPLSPPSQSRVMRLAAANCVFPLERTFSMRMESDGGFSLRTDISAPCDGQVVFWGDNDLDTAKDRVRNAVPTEDALVAALQTCATVDKPHEWAKFASYFVLYLQSNSHDEAKARQRYYALVRRANAASLAYPDGTLFGAHQVENVVREWFNERVTDAVIEA